MPFIIKHIESLILVALGIFVVSSYVNSLTHYSSYPYINSGAMILLSLLYEIEIYDKYKDKRISKKKFHLISVVNIFVFFAVLIYVVTNI